MERIRNLDTMISTKLSEAYHLMKVLISIFVICHASDFVPKLLILLVRLASGVAKTILVVRLTSAFTACNLVHLASQATKFLYGLSCVQLGYLKFLVVCLAHTLMKIIRSPLIFGISWCLPLMIQSLWSVCDSLFKLVHQTQLLLQNFKTSFTSQEFNGNWESNPTLGYESPKIKGYESPKKIGYGLFNPNDYESPITKGRSQIN